MTQKKLIECPVCGNQHLTYLKGYQKLYLLKCKKCSFVFDERIPSPTELNDYYSQSKYSDLNHTPVQTLNSFNKLLDFFEQYKESGNILDLGCGQGDFLMEAKKRNWNVYGSEYSTSATNLCEKRGIKMFQGELKKDIFDDIKFDVITSFEVIEHINTPNTFMSIVEHKLHQNGLVYFTTPNFNSLLRYFEKDRFKMIVYPIHISFYTKVSIKYLGRLNNFEPLKVKTTGLDIGRLINAIKPNKEENKSELNKHFHARKSITDGVRTLADSNLFIGLVKGIINYFLSIFGKGDTLKVFWIRK